MPRPLPQGLVHGSRLRPAFLALICSPVLGEHGRDAPSHLPLDGRQEWRQLQTALEATGDLPSGHPCPIRLDPVSPPTLAALTDLLHPHRERFPYQLVHVAACVGGDGRLRLEHENGREHAVSAAQFARAFRQAPPRVLLLMACRGLRYAQRLIEEGRVGAVVAFRDGLSEAEAAWLVPRLYARLLAGDTLGGVLKWVRLRLVAAYKEGLLPPEPGQGSRALALYGRQRAANLVLVGDPHLRLLLSRTSRALPPARSQSASWRNNLPSFPPLFLGRGEELVRMSDWMADPNVRCIGLVGIGGIGKSALALTAAWRNRWRFQAVIYVNARDHENLLDQLLREIQAVVGALPGLTHQTTREEKLQRLVLHLRRHRYLLLGDNLEVLAPAQADEFARFLTSLGPQSSTVALLTRRPRHRADPFGLDEEDARKLEVTPLALAPSIALLGELVAAHSADTPADKLSPFAKIPEHGEALADPDLLRELSLHTCLFGQREYHHRLASLQQLAASAHCHPFLLRGAVADLRTPYRTWEEVLRRLEHLQGANLQELVRDWIGRTLTELERRAPEAIDLLAGLMTFVGGATREALHTVWQRTRTQTAAPAAFEDALDRSRDVCLLDYDQELRRYDLPPLVRQYLVAFRRPSNAVREAWIAAHAAYFTAYTCEHYQHLDALDRERSNIFAMLDQASLDPDSTVRVSHHLQDFLLVRGRWEEARRILQRGLEAARQLLDHTHETELLLALAVFSRALGDHEASARYFAQTLNQIQAHPTDRAVHARALREWGVLKWTMGAYPQARQWFEEALELLADQPEPLERAKTLHVLAVVCRATGQFAESRRRFEAAIALARSVSDGAGTGVLAGVFHDLGVLYRVLGELPQARAYFENSLKLSVALRNPRAEAWTRRELGVVARSEGALDAAEDHFRESLLIEEGLHEKFGLARSQHDLGVLAMERKAHFQARQHLDRALSLQEELGDRRGQTATRYSLACLERRFGSPLRALQLHVDSLRTARALGDPYWEALNFFGLAWCAHVRQRPCAASYCLARCAHQLETLGLTNLLPLVRELQNGVWIADHL